MNSHPFKSLFIALFLVLAAGGSAPRSQTWDRKDLPGLDKLPVIKNLPDPFLLNDGTRVRSKADWARRREEIKSMLLYYEYGHMVAAPSNLAAAEVSSQEVREMEATEKQLLLSMGPQVQFHLILTIPVGKGPFPVVVKGDLCWGRVARSVIAEAVKRGYIVAEFDRTELAPDSTDRTKGVFPAYPDCDWTVLGGWAWGFQRTVDYLLTQSFVDPKRIAITGHSRGGKAALLAGALDERVALTAPNGSGCGGAGSYRVLGEKCEDLAAITKRFPFWFQPRLQEFIGHVDQLPFDQHFLKALVAPRAQLSTEALADLWANPMGTQVTYVAARQVYEYLGASSRIGIHFREGKHEQNAEDWRALLDFADLQFFGKRVETVFDHLAFPDAPRAYTWSVPQ